MLYIDDTKIFEVIRVSKINTLVMLENGKIVKISTLEYKEFSNRDEDFYLKSLVDTSSVIYETIHGEKASYWYTYQNGVFRLMVPYYDGLEVTGEYVDIVGKNTIKLLEKFFQNNNVFYDGKYIVDVMNNKYKLDDIVYGGVWSVFNETPEE